MKKVITGTFAAALFAVGVSAQTPAASQPPARGQRQMQDAAKPATVTGCLKAGDTPDSFMLSDLKWKDDKAVGTAGSARQPRRRCRRRSLKLVGSKLSDHVGHTVEVTGTIAAKADKAADPAARPAARSALAERQQHQDDRGDLPVVAIRSHFVASLPARHRVGLAFCASLAIVCW